MSKLRKNLMRRREHDGFTLIELLIVVVILAVLAAIVVFAVGGATNNASVAACKSDAKTLETALETYKAQFGSYPAVAPTAVADSAWTTFDNTVASESQIGLLGVTTVAAGSTIGPFLREAPNNTTHYQVWYDNSGNVFVAGPVGTGTEYTSGTNFDSNPNACNAAS